MVGIGAPSIRLKAFRLPPSSRIVTFSQTPRSLAFATPASTIFCASSEEMLCFLITLAIGHLPFVHSMGIEHFWRITLPRRPFPLHLFDLRSGVDAAVDRQVGAVDER